MGKNSSSDTPIYRFFDFFALIDTLTNRRLRFSAPSTFQDRNEGLEIIYNSLHAAVNSADGSYIGITKREDIQRFHSILKQNSFVCSWARDADSIALWSLYSSDHCGVRISSTATKLMAAVEVFARNHDMQSQFNRFGLAEDATYAFIRSASVTDVIYDDLRQLHKNILQGQSSQILSDLEKRGALQSFTLKDDAYKHEGEIRGIVTCGAMVPSEKTGTVTISEISESAPWLEGSHMYVDIPDGFVESVSIDPRCPKHKREAIERYVRDHNISISISQAFGYLPDEIDFTTPSQEIKTQ